MSEALNKIEAEIAAAKEHVEVGNALKRLSSNRDFKRIVREGYLEREAIRLVHLKSDPSMQDPTVQASIVSQIDSIGCLSSYFRSLERNAEMSQRTIEAGEQEREQLIAEQLITEESSNG